MKHSNSETKCILITHIVNPHQFYYKYADPIADSALAKFDFEIQLYGNELYAQRANENDGYVPVENELVIFYNVTLNKWIRGRVISVGREITFWCIDNGVWEKLTAPHVLPLREQFHKDMNVVHLGGLSLLPTEKAWNIDTEEVQTELSKGWDDKSVNLFKGILSKSKTFMFTEEFELDGHKFGSLAVESKKPNRKEINQILLEMNSAAHCKQYTDEDLWLYVHHDQMEGQLCKSIIEDSAIRNANWNSSGLSTTRTVQRSFPKYGSELSSVEYLASSEHYDDSVSRQSSDISATLEPDISATLEPEPARHRSGRQCEAETDSEDRKSPSVHQSQDEEATAATLISKDCYALEDTASVTSSVATNVSPIVTTKQNRGVKFPYEESYLRTCKIDHKENVRQQPLPSTMDWINSMSKSKLSDVACSIDKSCTSDSNDNSSVSQTLPTSTMTSRRNMLAALNKKRSATAATADATVKDAPTSAGAGNARFGIPAGYSKNCLESFGGINMKRAT